MGDENDQRISVTSKPNWAFQLGVTMISFNMTSSSSGTLSGSDVGYHVFETDPVTCVLQNSHCTATSSQCQSSMKSNLFLPLCLFPLIFPSSTNFSSSPPFLSTCPTNLSCLFLMVSLSFFPCLPFLVFVHLRFFSPTTFASFFGSTTFPQPSNFFLQLELMVQLSQHRAELTKHSISAILFVIWC